jgi:hypothetical protein
MEDASVTTQEQVTWWIDCVRAEYFEMPGLALTKCQMQRFWMIDARTCDAMVDHLVASGFLYHRPDDTYARAGLGV